jgi:Enoyl-CoA hydratase/isomerase
VSNDIGAGRAEADTVTYRVQEGIAWVSFNRPEKRNCMSPALNRQMLRVLDELEFREDVGVLVLTGEGSAWSAGMDLKEYFRETEAKGFGAIRVAQREAYGWWRSVNDDANCRRGNPHRRAEQSRTRNPATLRRGPRNCTLERTGHSRSAGRCDASRLWEHGSAQSFRAMPRRA